MSRPWVAPGFNSCCVIRPTDAAKHCAPNRNISQSGPGQAILCSVTPAPWSPDPAGVFLSHWSAGRTGKGVGEFRYVYDKAIDAVATGRMWIDFCETT